MFTLSLAGISSRPSPLRPRRSSAPPLLHLDPAYPHRFPSTAGRAGHSLRSPHPILLHRSTQTLEDRYLCAPHPSDRLRQAGSAKGRSRAEVAFPPTCLSRVTGHGPLFTWSPATGHPRAQLDTFHPNPTRPCRRNPSASIHFRTVSVTPWGTGSRHPSPLLFRKDVQTKDLWHRVCKRFANKGLSDAP